MQMAIELILNALGKERGLWRCSDISTEQVKTVCLALGPYRNLTTSLLFLHPTCQVLNHGGQRILGDRRLDWLVG
jgi:hypothetical protein